MMLYAFKKFDLYMFMDILAQIFDEQLRAPILHYLI